MRRAEPGEWQEERNPWGGVRRFRMIGNTKEYEGTIIIDGIEVPESQVEAFNKARAKAKKEELDRSQQQAVSSEIRLCPFKRSKNSLNYRCATDCAFYADGCVFAGRLAVKQTKGMYCPICNKCYTECTMYQNGCTFAQFLKSIH